MSAMMRAGELSFRRGRSRREFSSEGSKEDGEVANPF